VTAAELLALLPTFEAWTGRRAAEAVAARLEKGGDLVAAVHGALDERDRRRAAFADSAGGTPAAAYQAATGAAPDRRARRAIARGRLGRDALAERVARDVGRLENEALVAFLAARARELRGQPTLELEGAAERLADEPGWRLARAGWLLLAERIRGGRFPGAAVVARARALVTAARAPTWTQVAAIELLAAAMGAAASGVLAARLRPSGHPDDLFVRPAVARALARIDPGAARELLAATLDAEPSEHVRMELARVLGGLRAAGPLRRQLDPAREGSPRVRATAAVALAGIAPEALAGVLVGDPDDLPRRVALEEAEPLAPSEPALGQAIEALASGRAPASLVVARLAAEAAERLHQQRDPAARACVEALAAVRELREGAQVAVPAVASGATLGRALAVAATDDFGLQAWPVAGGFAVERGDRFRRRLWRALHEARHPAPEKRQGHLHTVGRVGRGPLRAPPGRLAEVTATRVPGERVLVPALGDWGRHLPTVDDLLSRPPGGVAFVFHAFGVTRIDFPRGTGQRMRARAALTLRYAEYAELRARSLAAVEAPERGRFAEAAARLGFTIRFSPYRQSSPAEIVDAFRGGGAAGLPELHASALPPLAELFRVAVDPSGSAAGHLAALTAAALGLFVVAQNEARRRIERARASIPLSLGGWGTRGKSGTERLKAALFQGLGCEVLAKTTGCEAMLIHALPGLPAQEVFIYRPYDKATVWEQQQLLELAARLGVDVFLWECMALRPEYVSILEQHWMRDDACTLTNTHPDHENIQGPAGIDIPRAMVDFIPRGAHLLTAEDSMLPVLREAAGQRATALSAAGYRDHALLPADVLARFPYQEHPRNIALVVGLARLLGLPADMALKEMADWVVPDLGVLKTYPEARWRGRRLEFSNGMSANERNGFLGNWERLAFNQPAGSGQWIVTVVNNRADRVSRSEVFAAVVVDDSPAHAHVLIGTNLAGLRGSIERELRRRVKRMDLWLPEEESFSPDRLAALALDRAFRLLEGVRLPEVGAVTMAETARAMAEGLGVDARVPVRVFETALADRTGGRRAPAASLRQELAAFAAALGPHGAEAVVFLEREATRHAAVLDWRDTVRAACASSGGRRACTAAFRALYAALFRDTLVTLEDPGLSGDQVLDAIARACPPGVRVRIMGVQNIKGTGLDFAYRWIAHERTVRLAARLAEQRGEETLATARELARAEDTGVLDGPPALAALHEAAARETGQVAADLRAAAEAVAQRQRQREEALGRRRRRAGALARGLGDLLDVYAGIGRRRRADRILEELARGHLSHERAARELRDLMKGQKGSGAE
jgi:poly-gamma-glutamate synthase PgsB/CapB